MIKVKIIALGKLKERYLKEAVEEYAKRLSALCSFEVIEIEPEKTKENPSDKEILAALKKEATLIEKKIPEGALTVALCIEGKRYSSVSFSKLFSDAAVNGKGNIVFLIGSSYGMDESLKKRADIKMSMSDMTFPHQLARVMLTEQIYRAFKIMEGGTYHK